MKRLFSIFILFVAMASFGCGGDESVGEESVSDVAESDSSGVEDILVEPDSQEPDTKVEDTEEPVPTGEELILSVPETEAWTFPDLTAPVHVVRTAGNVPHIYGEERSDVSFVMGFIMAQDRYLMMDLARRLGRGTISELFGRDGLSIDQESRGAGITYVAHRIESRFEGELAENIDAFCAGINAYIVAVNEGKAAPPSELAIASGLLGASEPVELMKDFTRIDAAAILAYILYESSYETGDIGYAAAMQQVPGLFDDAAYSELRTAGLEMDILGDITPALPISSAEGTGLNGTPQQQIQPGLPSTFGGSVPAKKGTLPTLSTELLDYTAARLSRPGWRLFRPEGESFGSNTWAVAGSSSTDGAALVAGDGHLALAIPSILYQIGLDTQVLGGGDLHQLGLLIPGFPLMNIGTNGSVGWSQTQVAEDITDWYAEEIQLDASGVPSHARFQEEWVPLVETLESYVIADIPVLGSVGGEETWSRWETADGRWITSVEGHKLGVEELLGTGQSVVQMMGESWVPGDENNDGVVSAISFDYVGLDAGDMLTVVDGFGRSSDVYEFREWTRGLTAYSQNFAVADSLGNILYTGYQAIPCRGYLARNPDGTFAEGADPIQIIDGTTYGGFNIPLKEGDVVVDEAPGVTDPYACVVPFDFIPQSINPLRGFVQNANNDPGNLSTDNSVTNDAYYVGGPWNNGFRADTIHRELTKAVQENTADLEKMAEIQGNHQSRLGEAFWPYLQGALIKAENLSTQEKEGNVVLSAAETRIVSLYDANSERFSQVQERLGAWADSEFLAASGVDTFYHTVGDGEKEDAVATMIFNAWFPRLLHGVFGDEGIPGIWRPKGSRGEVRSLLRFLATRGEGNVGGLGSHNPETHESIFFDVLGTDELETSDELILSSLAGALDFLSGPSQGPGAGGFDTADMAQWIWGLRHQVRFESLLLDFLGDNDALSLLADPFSITTNVLALAETFEEGDPREDLKWFPRPGDNWGVDAANPGFSGTGFTHGSGPVMRMVFSLNDGVVSGMNIIPGGQSALVESPFFADQAALWLGNETRPALFHVEDVVEGATGRELYAPSDN